MAGGSDPVLDRLDLAEHVDRPDDLDWVLHAAIDELPALQVISWVLAAQDLLDACTAGDAESRLPDTFADRCTFCGCCRCSPGPPRSIAAVRTPRTFLIVLADRPLRCMCWIQPLMTRMSRLSTGVTPIGPDRWSRTWWRYLTS